MFSRFKIALSLFALVGIALPMGAARADTLVAPVIQATIGDTAPTTQDLPFTLTIEHLAGIAAWMPVGTFQLKANATEDTQVQVNYAGEPYSALITIRASFLGMHQGHESWLLTVTRTDLVHDKPYSAPITSQLTLDRGGPGLRLVTRGHYGLQERRLRLGFQL
jgi:hypothetical protein